MAYNLDYTQSSESFLRGPNWWNIDEGDPGMLASRLFHQVRGIEEEQYEIAAGNFFNGCLYTNRELPGYDWSTGEERYVDYAPISMDAENVVTQVVETISALLGKNQPKPTPVVKDATFSIERMAADLDRYLYAEFKRQEVYEKGAGALDDSLWAAIAGLKIDFEYDDAGKPVDYYVERVLPDEIVVDQRDARDGRPLQMYQRKLVPVDTLKALYGDDPDVAMKIDLAVKSRRNYTSYRTPPSDMVVVVEGWRLPYLGMEGRHVIAIDNCVLVDEDYTRDTFPFVFLRWFEIPGSFYARPLVEELAPGQLRYNETDYKIRLCQDLVSVPRLFADQSSSLQVEQLDNSFAKIIRHQGNRPELVNWPAAHPEIYQERERERTSMFERAGISQLSAQSKLPENARLDSSRALREYNLIENQRFAKQAKRYENFYIAVAMHIIELSAELYRNGVNRKVSFHTRSVRHDIEWSDVAELCEDGMFQLQIEASSILNMTPSARMDLVNTWVFNGWIPPERGLALQGHPDVEEEVALMGARMADVKRTLEDLDRDVEVFPTPVPYQDIDLLIRTAQLTYLRRRNQVDVPAKVLENYEILIGQAIGLKQEATAHANASQKLADEQAMMQLQGGAPAGVDQLQANLQPTNIGPEGTMLPGAAVTAQGTPVEALI